jgi:hypothetical protein
MTTYTATRAASTFPIFKPTGAGYSATAWGTIDLTTALAATDVIKMCKLPRGAVVTGATLKGDTLASGATAASQSMVLNIGVDASVTTALGSTVTTLSTSTALAASTIPNGAAVANVKDAGYNWPLGGLITTQGPFQLQDDGTVYITVVASAGGGSFVSGTLTLVVDYLVA